MTGFYLKTMRGASVILLVIAVAIVILSLAANLMVYLQPQEAVFSPQQNFQVIQLFLSVTTALNNAVLPLIGAAALWRADRWLAAQPGVSA